MALVKIIPPGSPGNPYNTPIIDPVGVSRKHLDISYTPDKPHPMRKLDVFLPEIGEGPFPVLVYMHGGAFIGGLKNDFHMENYLKSIMEGFAFVSVEQRLLSPKPDGTLDPEGVFPYPLFDFKAAIRFLRANAAAYKLDPGRFALLGTSAGGYHAAMAAATQGVPAMYDESLGFVGVSEQVQAVVDLFGVGDLMTQSAFDEEKANKPQQGLRAGAGAPPGPMPVRNMADAFLGVSCLAHPNLALLANPETWVTPDLPPMLIRAGAADAVVPVECSRRLAKRIEEVCGKERVEYDEYPDYAHGDPRFHEPTSH
jgi:acetyl esterase/lipase